MLLVGIGQGFDCGIMLLVGFSQARNGGTVFNDGPFGGRHAVVDCTDLLVGLDNGLFVDFNVVLVVLGELVKFLNLGVGGSGVVLELSNVDGVGISAACSNVGDLTGDLVIPDGNGALIALNS